MARSLVERLREQSRLAGVSSTRRDECSPGRFLDVGESQAFLAAAILAAPYEARRLALERAFADAKAAQGRHGLVTAWRFLEEALATVPEIPEES